MAQPRRRHAGRPGLSPSPLYLGTVLAPILLLLAALRARAQFVRDSALYAEKLAEEKEKLTAQLRSHPDLEDIYYPDKYSIPTDFYVRQTPTGYTQNVVFDPCRGFEYNCCLDTFAAPEFRRLILDPDSDNYGEEVVYKDTGEEMSLDASRLPERMLFIDDACTDFLTPRADCVSSRIAKKNFPQMPKCWNYNESIVATNACRAPKDGAPMDLCIELAITQTAYIVECGGDFRDDAHCGTFLEIHRPGSKEVLSEVRVRGQYTSGYRMIPISSTYKANSSLSLCEGHHEIWWVQRTRYNWIVEKILPFYIISPRCDWDETKNVYKTFATVATAQALTGIDPYAPERFLFSRPRTVGTPGIPGPGMGATAMLPRGTEFPLGARFIYGDRYTYSYTPPRPDLSVRDGELWQGHPDAQ